MKAKTRDIDLNINEFIISKARCPYTIEINAKVYLPPDSVEAGGHWDLKKWVKQHGELILEAAVEVKLVF